MLIDSINNKTSTTIQSKGTKLNLKSKVKYLHSQNQSGWLQKTNSLLHKKLLLFSIKSQINLRKMNIRELLMNNFLIRIKGPSICYRISFYLNLLKHPGTCYSII
jgi:hypothetical protein